jgi:hypothetical protein
MKNAMTTAKISIKHADSSAFIEGIYFLSRGGAKTPVIRRKKPASDINLLMPDEITAVCWSDLNEEDMIKYKSARGEEFLVQDSHLLRDITGFMFDNGLRGDIPYIHIKGKFGWECYPKPGNNHILVFLMLHLPYFDIYTCEGELVKEADPTG